MGNMDFESWFNHLVIYARDDNNEDLINKEDPESYRDYWEDGDSPEDTYYAELDAADQFEEE